MIRGSPYFLFKDFNPRPPWGGRLYNKSGDYPTEKFQSTPSVGRATTGYLHQVERNRTFQSTPSVGRATATRKYKFSFFHISIHALRGEGDKKVVN